MKILIFDNYDSFTYNVVNVVRELGFEPEIYRNDKIDIEDIAQYDKIILSPGPGIPSEAGILMSLLKKYASTKSILGICLGHQAIAESFGATLTNMDKVMHGLKTPICIVEEDYIFNEMSDEFEAGRYHSWLVDKENLPKDIIVTALDYNGQIMALKHSKYDVHGVQFHPESILTPEGKKIIENFLSHSQK